MSGFTQRSVQRALGTSGRIQPRIVDATALEPWMTRGSGAGLEIIEQVERGAEHEPTAAAEAMPSRASGPTRRSVAPRDERPGVAPDASAERGSSWARPPERFVSLTASPRPTLEADRLVRPHATRERVGTPVAPAGTTTLETTVSEIAAITASRVHTSFEVDDLPSARTARSSAAPLPRPRTPEVEHATIDRMATESGRADEPGAPVRAMPALRRTPEPTRMRKIRELGLRVPEPHDDAMAEPASPWPSTELLLRLAPTRPGRRGAAQASEPVVRIDIGRVELRAAPSPARPPRIGKPGSFVSLQQYLHKRGGA